MVESTGSDPHSFIVLASLGEQLGTLISVVLPVSSYSQCEMFRVEIITVAAPPSLQCEMVCVALSTNTTGLPQQSPSLVLFLKKRDLFMWHLLHLHIHFVGSFLNSFSLYDFDIFWHSLIVIEYILAIKNVLLYMKFKY